MALTLLSACNARPPATRRSFLAMGTLGSVSLPADESRRLAEATAIVTNVLRGLEERLSVYRPESELARLNAQAGIAPAPVSRELRELLVMAKAYGELSGGAFDITIGPLMKLWGFNGKQPPAHSLTPEQVRPVLDKIGWRHIVLSNDTAFLNQAGIQVDLGGIAKGYAVDRCCAELLNHGFSNALVNLGGNMRALGAPAENRMWQIAVRNPFEPGQSLGVLRLSNGQAVATSGNYERFVTLDGRRFAHIMDPRTGFPVSGMAGITVLAPTAVDADVLATALFVLGMPEGLKILQKKPGCSALFVPDRKPLEILFTPGFDKRFQPDSNVAERVRALPTTQVRHVRLWWKSEYRRTLDAFPQRYTFLRVCFGAGVPSPRSDRPGGRPAPVGLRVSARLMRDKHSACHALRMAPPTNPFVEHHARRADPRIARTCPPYKNSQSPPWAFIRNIL